MEPAVDGVERVVGLGGPAVEAVERAVGLVERFVDEVECVIVGLVECLVERFVDEEEDEEEDEVRRPEGTGKSPRGSCGAVALRGD